MLRKVMMGWIGTCPRGVCEMLGVRGFASWCFLVCGSELSGDNVGCGL